MQPLLLPLITIEKGRAFFGSSREEIKRELCQYTLFLMTSILWPD